MPLGMRVRGISHTMPGEKDRKMEEEDRKKDVAPGGGLRICRRCLTREMMGEQKEYFRNLHEYIANLDEGLKAPSALYEKRLAVCRECRQLYQGMCRICGCYVELRAAVAKNNCPEKAW